MKLSYELTDNERLDVIRSLRASGDDEIANKIENHHRLTMYNDKIKSFTLKDLIDEIILKAWNDGNEGRERWTTEIALCMTLIVQKIDELEDAANDC